METSGGTWHVFPDETIRGKLGKPASVHFRNEWPLASFGHITQQLLALHVDVHKPQGRRGLCLRSRWTRQLISGIADVIKQLQARRNRRHVVCRLAAIRSSDDHRSWPEQCVGHHVVHTRHVANISCKFCQVGHLPTLHGLPPIIHLAQCIG
jgi:hypothetical protein